MRKFYVLLLILAIMAPCMLTLGADRKRKKDKTEQKSEEVVKKKSKYDELLKKSNVVTAKGDFVTVHKIGGKIYFEYPLKYMGRDVLLGGTVSATSEPMFVNLGFKYQNPMLLEVVIQDSTVFFNKKNVAYSRGTDEAWARKAVERNFIPRLYKRFPVAAYNIDSTAVVIDVTELLNNNPELSPEGYTGMFKNTLMKESSFFGKVKAFEDNVSVEINQEVQIGMEFAIFKASLGKVSTRSVISMLLLPEKKMNPRVQDSRVGIFPTYNGSHENGTLPFREISQTEDGLRLYNLANRWRLEPKDIKAWERGELVEPVKPIVWYVDDAFPDEWREPIKAGVLIWNQAFEKIGFKNAIQVRDFPVNDPSFDPDNLKYSCLRYLPTPDANAMGPSWVDPTTGEIVNASVIVYNNIIQLINNWRFVQTAQVDSRVRAKKMPKDVMDESIAYVIAHEIGHTLGLMHNMAGSAAIPVDSLRSASFTREYGTTASIMDYARFNYVAQPGDKGVKLTPPGLGVYDEYVIKWLYSPIPQAKDMWEEAAIAEKWIDEKAGDPYYRYGRQQIGNRYDPSAFEEDLGDDPVKAGTYGIKNLKYILENMNEWIKDDEDLRYRSGIYLQIQQQYFRYLMNVLYQVGGIYLTQVKDGTDGEPVRALDRKKQKESLAWVINELLHSEWINAPQLSDKFDLDISASANIINRVSYSFLSTLATNVTLSSHVSKEKVPYSVREYYDDLYLKIFAPTIQGRKLTTTEKALQNAFLLSGFSAGGGGSMAALTNDSRFVPSEMSPLPSLDEIRAYGLDESGVSKIWYEQLQQIEARYGKGSVARALFDNNFGRYVSPFQNTVFVDAISELGYYNIVMLRKVRDLVKGKVATAHRDDKAYYEGLLIKLNKFFK
ncbi:zinc-dependent metalloprotease [uncultured Butyricimonas sp.]|uniref:zinc-dependent metalloprotease n=1 Tax=uncultured Butyricimonas sp. TaxID=1268785 RepID=UPI0026DC3115|nr:zinc-dependent metalloprotease [uncultured Butyricimonas sp.]